MEATPAASANAPRGRLTASQWLGRAAAGLVLGWIWSSLVTLGWLGLAAAPYGDLDRALARLKDEPWGTVGFAGYLASVPASFLGGLVGPLAAGRSRRSVLGNSARGGAWGAALGAAAGLLAGWAFWQYAPRSLALVWVALGLGVAAGLVGGWLGGQAGHHAFREGTGDCTEKTAPPMREVEVKDLKPMQGPAHSSPRPGLRGLSDDELLHSVRNPKNGDFLTENTRTGTLVDGNGRAQELLRRAADPNSTIKPDTKVPVAPYTPDLSMFPDLD